MRHLVDADRDGEDQRVLLAFGDLDPVGVADAEPALRYLGDVVAAPLDLVLVVDDVALRLHVLAAVDLDREPLAQRGDQRFLDRRDGVATALDLHRVADVQLLLLHGEELRTAGILEHERVADPHGLAVDLERPVAGLVLDPEVVADREQLLAHPVLRAAVVVAAPQQSHAVPPWLPVRLTQARRASPDISGEVLRGTPGLGARGWRPEPASTPRASWSPKTSAST